MSNHIGNANKMVSDTPISDSTPHNVAELGMLCRRLERLASVRLSYIILIEAQNDAANAKIERLTNKVAQLYEGAEEQKQRIKRLEKALEGTVKWIVHLADSGDAGFWNPEEQSVIIAARAALEAKEAKP